MKNVKTTEAFWFKGMTHQQVADQLDEDYPIDLRHNIELVNRVYSKCPFLEKNQISLIIKTIFKLIRSLFILGKILNFHNLFFDTKLKVFPYHRGDAIFPSVKVCISTPPKLKK